MLRIIILYLTLYLFFFVIVVLARRDKNVDYDEPLTSDAPPSSFFCKHIPMPVKSHFMGMDPPNDPVKWSQAIEDSCSGKLVLLKQLLKQTNNSDEIYEGGITHMWSHRLGDMHVSNGMSIKSVVKGYYEDNGDDKAPIVHLGHRVKKSGGGRGFKEFSTKNLCEYKEKLPGKAVFIGCMDSNWGYLSTNMMNRSVYWKRHLGPSGRTKGLSSQQLVQDFLDNPSVLMFVVSGHNNITHPKLVSMPLGPTSAHHCNKAANMVVRENEMEINKFRKRSLLFTAGSNWKFRPAIRECVNGNMKGEMVIRSKLSADKFMATVIESAAVLCMPGLGYDSYRIWETLLLGAMPVLEKGCGMDRTFWKLPVLLVDDFAYVNPEIIHSAYLEALYRRDEWEYYRLTKRFWKKLITGVAKAKDNRLLLDLFPMKAMDEGFTRPLFAFNCEEMGGCGPGTKRTPKKYCAIDRTIDFNSFTAFD